MTIDTLRHVPLFESLDDESARQLCELLESTDCKAETSLFRAGDEGDAMYLIERGKVRICVHATDGREMMLTELGRGDFFGEMVLLDGQRRSADAIVAEDARLGCTFARAFSFVYAEQSRMSRWKCSPRSPTACGARMSFYATAPRAMSMWKKRRSVRSQTARRILSQNLVGVGNSFLPRSLF